MSETIMLGGGWGLDKLDPCQIVLELVRVFLWISLSLSRQSVCLCLSVYSIYRYICWSWYSVCGCRQTA